MAGGPPMGFGDGPAPLKGAKLALGGFALALSNFVVLLDITIANVSVPHIAGSLAVSPTQGTWVLTSYAVAEAICVPLTGWLARTFGAVRVFIMALLGFGLFSMLCGMAGSLSLLIAFRVCQGLCGGPIMPMTQTLLLRIFPKDKGGAALGLWAMTVVVAPIAGPICGGFISDNWSWHWLFFINIPLAAFSLIVAWRLVRPYETPTQKSPIDFVGLALLVIWVGSLQIMLDKGREEDWFSSGFIITLTVVAIIGFISFLIWELTEDHPIIDLSVFRNRGFTVAVVTQCVAYAAFFSFIVLIPLFLQTNLNYTATWAGLAVGWVGVLAVVFSPIVARFVGKVDTRGLISFGILWLAVVAWLRTRWVTDMGYWTIAFPQMLQGLGMPFFFVGSTALAMASVRPDQTASGAGIQNFMRTMAGAFATSMSTTLWEHFTKYNRAELVGLIHPPTHTGLPAAQASMMLSQLVQTEAVTLATRQVFMVCTIVLFVSAGMIWLAPKPGRKKG
ncbi:MULTISPECIES: DHA2 family efflux MFS transporter permease subunit [unclassified Novosphingobium]|uniref:DHA2 family efflux MFS transporter permease subunit n=1 Tax=unclassified Novosphingobium TaxID=2644732 RepID=UPI00042490CF|nr:MULTISPECIES: DHA2 family efflux MFS transporter permease subunit [unclassified Novosphingobium]KPF52294.1 multidrug resistance protein B [Novosphingobium sp. AAP1]MBB3359451.1 DHA2 family multidrug resistance protein [Novosphingobium sp. BK256]MBB3375811.1 DHA2 family multidrug resistance protein [Novosphingobium sp. BK280]MBB3380224.1 DHA2 family multidrug resistance protein [Novosphingobium sp. BK258]MBB3421918.1 DHA2 family multidrug resistance protein [Novosphingobium sp. BK267]